MDKTIDLRSLLDERRVEILERWTQRIRWEHTDKDLSRGELRDQLPRFFDEVLKALSAEEEDVASNRATASAEHGTQGLRVGFDLPEVIREYEILTECILEEVQAVGGTLSIGQLRCKCQKRGHQRTAELMSNESDMLGMCAVGLGLAIVKQAIEAHGGRVSVKNLAHKGCIFTLQLPIT